jgi:hypothetical protein
LCKDSIAEQGGVNLYAASGNNLVNSVDYLGMISITDCLNPYVDELTKSILGGAGSDLGIDTSDLAGIGSPYWTPYSGLITNRPSADDVWANYFQEGDPATNPYAVSPKDVYDTVGGKYAKEADNPNTDANSLQSCALRMSCALDASTDPIPANKSGNLSVMGPDGKSHDLNSYDNIGGQGYISAAADMDKYLQQHWGPPDTTTYPDYKYAYADVNESRAALNPGEVEVFTRDHHTAVVTPDYADKYANEVSSIQRTWILKPALKF